jgi:hypothetical protein
MECELMRYVVNKDIMPLYLDTAKTYMNLSAGALALTIVFREKVVGSQPGTRVSAVMLMSWMSFLLAIGSSALYQYFAVKFLDSVSCAPGPIQYFESFVKNPGRIYGVMLVFFFVGSSFLVLAGWRQLPWKHS